MSTTRLSNFRPAAGLPGIYRCGVKADQYLPGVESNTSGLMIVDLRSDAERKITTTEQQRIVSQNGFQLVRGMVPLTTVRPRTVLQLDLLANRKFMKFLETTWMTRDEQKRAAIYKQYKRDRSRLHKLRIKVMNEQGLVGLNQAILETGKEEICYALKAITQFCQSCPGIPIVIHCAQGKDRTGMLVMLLQSVFGVSTREIVECYHRSENARSGSSAARIAAEQTANGSSQRTKGIVIDKQFSLAPREVMETTLSQLKSKYGSVLGYLDAIGFGHEWRQHLIVSLNSNLGGSSMSRL